jgi:DNA-binding NtrC family response regulator
VEPFELDKQATARWMSYPFPGNVRELRNIVIRLTTKYGGQRVSAEALEDELDSEIHVPDPLAALTRGEALEEMARKHLSSTTHFNLDQTLKQWEKAYVEAALKITHGNLSQAAKLLGVNRTTLYSRMQSYENAARE